MGRAGNWGLPVRLARMLHEVKDINVLARIEVRSGTGWNARHTPTLDPERIDTWARPLCILNDTGVAM